MKIAVFGSGMVGRALAGKLDELGHQVVLGTCDVETRLAESTPSRATQQTFAQWHQSNPALALGSIGRVATGR